MGTDQRQPEWDRWLIPQNGGPRAHTARGGVIGTTPPRQTLPERFGAVGVTQEPAREVCIPPVVVVGGGSRVVESDRSIHVPKKPPSP